MARPKKQAEDKKSKRMTIYFTPEEKNRLNLISQSGNISKTQIINQALNLYIKTIEDPPEPLKKATHENIMALEQEQVSGYICQRGHTFWLEWAWPSEPVNCPACGDKNVKSTWNGLVRKGF